MQLRRAERRDREFIVEMARLAYGLEDRPLPFADDPEVLALVPGPTDVAVVATEEGGAGLGAAWWHLHEPPLIIDDRGQAVPEVAMAVREAARANGIGGRLLEQLAVEAVNAGFDALALNVHLRSPATRLSCAAASGLRAKGVAGSASRWCAPSIRQTDTDDGRPAATVEERQRLHRRSTPDAPRRRRRPEATVGCDELRDRRRERQLASRTGRPLEGRRRLRASPVDLPRVKPCQSLHASSAALRYGGSPPKCGR